MKNKRADVCLPSFKMVICKEITPAVHFFCHSLTHSLYLGVLSQLYISWAENHFLPKLFLFSGWWNVFLFKFSDMGILTYLFRRRMKTFFKLIVCRDEFPNLYVRVTIAIVTCEFPVLVFRWHFFLSFYSSLLHQVHGICACICLLAHLHSDYSCTVSSTSKANAEEEKIDCGDFGWVHEHQEALRKLSISACFPISPNRRNSTGHAKFNSHQGHTVRKRYKEHQIQTHTSVLENMFGIDCTE